MEKINLGDLALTAEDFRDELYGVGVSGEPFIIRDFSVSVECATKVANRILAEKLGRATKVGIRQGSQHDGTLFFDTGADTHTARLVCVEALNSQSDES